MWAQLFGGFNLERVHDDLPRAKKPALHCTLPALTSKDFLSLHMFWMFLSLLSWLLILPFSTVEASQQLRLSVVRSAGILQLWKTDVAPSVLLSCSSAIWSLLRSFLCRTGRER